MGNNTMKKYVPTPYSYSSAVAAGDFIYLGLHRGFGNDFITQIDNTFSRLQNTLAELEIPLSNLVMAYVWFKDIKDVPAMEKRFMEYFEKGKYPARTGGSTEFIDDDCLFMMHGIACRKEVDMMKVKRIPTNFSFSTAVAAGDYVFIGHHRGFGNGFATQFDDMFSRLKKTLSEFRLTLDNLTQVNVRLKNIKDLPEMEKRFNDYFKKDNFPARMTTTTRFIDNDCLLMIDGVAYRENHE
jgi:2-iminobutanoate/2-iminopropanoate deaminase